MCLTVYDFGEQIKNRLALKQIEKIENCEETNFHVLELILKIIRESERQINSHGTKAGKGWLCNWN